MSKPSSRGSRSRWKKLNVAASRERRRIARLDRQYDPNRVSNEHSPQKNPRYKTRGKPKGEQRIVLPQHLDFSSPENSVAVFRLLANIRGAVLKHRLKKVVLDHSKVDSLAPEAALALLAEIQRCRAYCDTRTKLTGTYPRSAAISRLLHDIGFFEALQIKSPPLAVEAQHRKYVKVVRHNRTLAAVVDDVLSCFAEEVNFTPDARKRLQIALVECMDNVFEHAYAVDSEEPYLFREWWLVGFSDHDDGSISFSFYDQGAGIAATIKGKLEQRIIQRLRGWSDGRWLERGVRKPISRHESARRGHGLNKLKTFIDRLDIDATLRVIANHGDVEFPGAGNPVITDHEVPLRGTLIVWTLRPRPAEGTPAARLTLE